MDLLAEVEHHQWLRNPKNRDRSLDIKAGGPGSGRHAGGGSSNERVAAHEAAAKAHLEAAKAEGGPTYSEKANQASAATSKAHSLTVNSEASGSEEFKHSEHAMYGRNEYSHEKLAELHLKAAKAARNDIKAGGPGSGRHAGSAKDVLLKHGYTDTGKKPGIKFEKGTSAAYIQPDGTVRYMSDFEFRDKMSPDELDEHITKLEK